MIDRILSFLLSRTTGLRALVSLALLLVGGGLLFRLSPYPDVRFAAGRSLPEETLTGPSDLHQFLADLTPSVRELYLSFQGWDLLNPILMGLAGVMVLGWLMGGSSANDSRLRWILLLPILAAGADVTENLLLALAITAFPDPAQATVALPMVSGLKFLAVTLMTIAVLALLARSLWRRVGPTPASPRSS